MADVNLDKTTLHAAVALGQKLAAPHEETEIPYAVIPEGSKIESLEKLAFPDGRMPVRRKAHVQMSDALSLIRYVTLYQDDRTRIFADPKKQSFLAILDYHGVGERAPEYLEHKAGFQTTQSQQWITWYGSNNKELSQVDFAEFIEDNMRDIASPTPAEMLEVARDLKAKTDVNFGSSIRLSNGQTQLKYEETIKASVGTGNVQVPEHFSIAIPVFYGEDRIVVQVRLRFRISQGKLTFHYKMNNPFDVLNEAFEKVVSSISGALKTDVLLGTP